MTRLQVVPQCSRVSVPIHPPHTCGLRYIHSTLSVVCAIVGERAIITLLLLVVLQAGTDARWQGVCECVCVCVCV